MAAGAHECELVVQDLKCDLCKNILCWGCVQSCSLRILGEFCTCIFCDITEVYGGKVDTLCQICYRVHRDNYY